VAGLFVAGIPVAPPAARAAAAVRREIRVVAKVGARVVTDFQVLADLVLEDPSVYKKNLARATIPPDVFDQALTRYVTQVMAAEENRILGLVRVPRAETEAFVASAQKALGKQWKSYLNDFELSDAQVRSLAEEKLLLRAGLASRFKAAQAKLPPGASAETKTQVAQKAIDEWLDQLRSRYRVQPFRDEGL
jgi:hypothetical protein